MRIVHIITRLILGGAQENTLLTVEGLHHRYGDEVTLITGPAIGPEGSLMDRARQRGLSVHVLPALRRAVHLWRDWTSYRALVRLLRHLSPDVVHTHSSKAGIVGRAAADRAGVPVIVHTVHGPPFHEYEKWWRNRQYMVAERWAARRTTAFISVCRAMTDRFVAAGIAPPEKFTTIYSGMEVEPFLQPPRPRLLVRTELGYEPSHVVIGKVARLFELKGHDDVLAAARQLAARYPQVRFLFVGDGVRRQELETAAAQAGLEPICRFVGLVPPERMPELLTAMDIVVHCSLREGLARVLPQALIAGRPVVSYDIGGAAEVVLPGQTGYLVRPGDVAGLTDALGALIEHPEKGSQFGLEGRRRFTDQFRHDRMVDRIRQLYTTLLTGPVTDQS